MVNYATTNILNSAFTFLGMKFYGDVDDYYDKLQSGNRENNTGRLSIPGSMWTIVYNYCGVRMHFTQVFLSLAWNVYSNNKYECGFLVQSSLEYS